MQHMNSHRSVKIVLPTILGYERIAMACSASFAQMNGLAADRIEDLKTIVGEAATNAMEHGNGGRAEAHVTIQFESAEEAINVMVNDEGNGFDNTVQDPDIEQIINDKEAPVGFGLFLIRNLADHVTYRQLPGGGHCVEMRIAMQH